MGCRLRKIGVESLQPRRKRGQYSASYTRAYRQALDESYEKTEDQMQRFFDKTVKTWKKKPKAKVRRIQKGKFVFLELEIMSKVWHWLNAGTVRHYVAPKKAKALAFKSGYKAKTKAGRLSSKSGGARGKTRFSKGHWVSGIKARGWSTIIEKAATKTLSFALQQNLKKRSNEVARRLGK